MVGSTRVPADLPGLLRCFEITDVRNGRAYTVPLFQVPNRVIDAFGATTTAKLLALPARSFQFGSATKIALANDLAAYMAREWGPDVTLGALAPEASAGRFPVRHGPPDPDAPLTGAARRAAGLAAIDIAMANLKARERTPT